MSEADGELDLPPGMREDAFVEAVASSGYPLQIVVGAALAERGYGLEEEWAFNDPDSGERRAIDVVALREGCHEPAASETGTTSFAQALLIECKQSRHPHLFFESVAPPELDDFPVMLGIGRNWVKKKGSNRETIPIGAFLGTEEKPLMKSPPMAASLSRAEAKSSKVVLSGEHPHNSLLMPLSKALNDYERRYQGSSPSEYGSSERTYDLRLALPLAVIDGPMVFVQRPSSEPQLRAIQWVRMIVRHPVTWQRHQTGTFKGGGGFSVIDVVHRSFLEDFLDQHWKTFGTEFFAGFAAKNEEIIGNAG